ERSCILKHIKRTSISDYFKKKRSAAQSGLEETAVKSYGEIFNYHPLISGLELKDPFDVIGEYVVKLFVPQELLKKINSLAKGDIVFFEFEIREKRQAIDYSAAAEDAGSENVLVLKEIIPYMEASYSFSAFIKAEENALAPDCMVLIKHLTERYEGSIPLFIKIGELTIATNKKINFSEKFIREIRSIEKLSAGIDFYIELK
ncbi:MAG TPA: hypothetical protein PKL57_21855, partial [Candidatus Wallbacteria bacterium]|nr:hypothetical protein [Candidatus Wallbacteria bacterium]